MAALVHPTKHASKLGTCIHTYRLVSACIQVWTRLHPDEQPIRRYVLLYPVHVMSASGMFSFWTSKSAYEHLNLYLASQQGALQASDRWMWSLDETCLLQQRC
uniref:Uncharacterized protein n=1 Tax=Zea mays TaxID=4577 RepID=A0A804P659_MAIZE